MAVIYQITNMINGKYYIGSTSSFERRTWQHKHDLRRGCHKNPKLQAAWNKYGEDAFVFEVIEPIPEGQDQLQYEDLYLFNHVGRAECYNINPGAESPRTGVVLSAEAKQNISAARKGKHAGPDHYRYGTTLAQEVRDKISATQKGRPNPRKGTPMSEQGRANVTAAIKRGEDSHFYGKRPTNADDLQRAVVAVLPDRTRRKFPSLSIMRDTLGVSIATIIRACKSGKPVRQGACGGWVLSYADATDNAAPEIPAEYLGYPRTRAEAKAVGAKLYFTGLPCEKGHIAPRKTKGACVECLKLEWATQNAKRARKAIDAPKT